MDEYDKIDAWTELVLNNVKLIYDSPKECLSVYEFQLTPDGPTYEREEIIRYMLEMDLVENEEDNSVFYLTHETYEALEQNELYSIVYNYFYTQFHIESDEEEQQTEHEEDFENESDELEDSAEKSKGWVQILRQVVIGVWIIIIALLIGSIISERKNSSQIDPEILNNLKIELENQNK